MFHIPRPPRATHERIRVPSRAFADSREVPTSFQNTAEIQGASAAEPRGARPRAAAAVARAKDSDSSGGSGVEDGARRLHRSSSSSASHPAHTYATQATSRQRTLLGRWPQSQDQQRLPAMAANRSSLPVSSSTGGGTPSLRQYHSPMRTWVWAAFGANVVLAAIFAALCASSYKVGDGIWWPRPRGIWQGAACTYARRLFAGERTALAKMKTRLKGELSAMGA